MGKPQGKTILGRPRRRWENNIKMDLIEVDCVPIDWIALLKIRTRGGNVMAVMNLIREKNSEKKRKIQNCLLVLLQIVYW